MGVVEVMVDVEVEEVMVEVAVKVGCPFLVGLV